MKALALLALVAVVAAGAARAGEMPAYVFTQAHGGSTQTVAAGAPLQVQLPANPALWRFDPEASRNVRFLGSTLLFSPGRIAETAAVQVLDFERAEAAPARIVVRTRNLPVPLRRTLPDGTFTIELLPAAE